MLWVTTLPAKAVTTRLDSDKLAASATNTYVLTTDGDWNAWTNPATLPGGAPPGADTYVPYNDNGSWGAEVAFTYNDATDMLIAGTFLATTHVGAGTYVVATTYVGAGTHVAAITDVFSGESYYAEEQADAGDDIPGDGQFWVHDDAPNTPMFTDDAGNDHQLGVQPVLLEFTLDGNVFADAWSELGGQITTSATIGWIPMRNCSITGISCQTGAALVVGGSQWDIEVYGNGAEVWSDTLEEGGDAAICVSTQAAGTDSITAGQVISVNFNLIGGIEQLVNPHVLIEITYD